MRRGASEGVEDEGVKEIELRVIELSLVWTTNWLVTEVTIRFVE